MIDPDLLEKYGGIPGMRTALQTITEVRALKKRAKLAADANERNLAEQKLLSQALRKHAKGGPRKFVGEVELTRKWRHEMTTLEIATRIALSGEELHKTMWSRIWPIAHCMNTSLVLAPLLRMALEWDVRIVVGIAEENRPHAWIESPEGDIIDPTYGMFDGGPALRVLPAGQTTNLGHMGKHWLTRAGEEHFRNSLKPKSHDSGWAEGCGMMDLFDNEEPAS